MTTVLVTNVDDPYRKPRRPGPPRIRLIHTGRRTGGKGPLGLSGSRLGEWRVQSDGRVREGRVRPATVDVGRDVRDQVWTPGDTQGHPEGRGKDGGYGGNVTGKFLRIVHWVTQGNASRGGDRKSMWFDFKVQGSTSRDPGGHGVTPRGVDLHTRDPHP